MATELSKGKTMVVLAIMAACFAILFPKIFLPMLQQQPTNPQHLPGTQDPHVPPALRERDTTGNKKCYLYKNVGMISFDFKMGRNIFSCEKS